MNKITEEAAQNFVHGNDFKKSNTEVLVTNSNWNKPVFDTMDNPRGSEMVKMLLFGNEIARRYRKENILQLSSCGWETRTTKTRINGILDMLRMPFSLRTVDYGFVLFTEDNKPIKWEDKMIFRGNDLIVKKG